MTNGYSTQIHGAYNPDGSLSLLMEALLLAEHGSRHPLQPVSTLGRVGEVGTVLTPHVDRPRLDWPSRCRWMNAAPRGRLLWRDRR